MPPKYERRYKRKKLPPSKEEDMTQIIRKVFYNVDFKNLKYVSVSFDNLLNVCIE